MSCIDSAVSHALNLACSSYFSSKSFFMHMWYIHGKHCMWEMSGEIKTDKKYLFIRLLCWRVEPRPLLMEASALPLSIFNHSLCPVVMAPWTGGIRGGGVKSRYLSHRQAAKPGPNWSGMAGWWLEEEKIHFWSFLQTSQFIAQKGKWFVHCCSPVRINYRRINEDYTYRQVFSFSLM